MKVTVKDNYLNVRFGKPSVNAPCYQYLAPGSQIEVDGKIYKGDKYGDSDIDTWLKDAGGNYYWRGGVSDQIIKDAANFDFWLDQFDILDIQKIETGNKSKVLILDSGINDFLPAFNEIIIPPILNFVPKSKTSHSIDSDCHGSHCAALIASMQTQYVIGVALKAKLYVAKVTENGELKDATPIKEALTEFLKNQYDFDIISISQTLITDDPDLQNLIQQHVDRNRIVIAAIGNDSQFINSDKKRYPGFYTNCISVGACESNNTLSKYTCYPSKADIFCYGTNISSYKDDSFPEPLTGTSQATAIVSGICALIISFLKKNNIDYKQDAIRHLLKKYSSNLTGFPNYRLVQPSKIFDKLLKLKQNENRSLQDFMDTDASVSS